MFHSFWRMVRRGLPEASIITKLEGGGGGGEEREREREWYQKQNKLKFHGSIR